MTDRTIIAVSGADRVAFLQNLITNDVTRAGPDALVYAALLTPQGKYLADFLIHEQDGALLLDVAASHAAPLAQRLMMYRLRAKVEIAESPLQVAIGDAGLIDPRHPDLPRRSYGTTAHAPDPVGLRVAHCIPQTGVELTPDSYILEAGFERLNGVDFKKGCYVGQEVTARMKHKTTLRKGLRTVAISGSAPVGTAIMAGDKQAGTLFTQSGEQAIAYLRFDRATGALNAGGAEITT